MKEPSLVRVLLLLAIMTATFYFSFLQEKTSPSKAVIFAWASSGILAVLIFLLVKYVF